MKKTVLLNFVTEKHMLAFAACVLSVASLGQGTSRGTTGGLINFSAKLDKDSVNLTWSSNDENLNHYVVQKSSDGRTYQDIAVVFTNENGKSSNSYMMKDGAQKGSSYYRIQMVNKTNDIVKLSDVRLVKITGVPTEPQLFVYPNPVVNTARVIIPDAWKSKKTMISITGVDGRPLKTIQPGRNVSSHIIDFTYYTAGIYVIQVSCDDKVVQYKILKQTDNSNARL